MKNIVTVDELIDKFIETNSYDFEKVGREIIGHIIQVKSEELLSSVKINIPSKYDLRIFNRLLEELKNKPFGSQAYDKNWLLIIEEYKNRKV